MWYVVAACVTLFAVTAGAQELAVTEKLVQQPGAQLSAHIGGQIFKITRSSPLPNVFGRADIFGRTIDRGSVELRYQGLTPDGKLVFDS